MNKVAPRFVGEFPSNLYETRARLLDFADFLDSLKLTKFNHDKWCRPDHTCKTEACGAGWAAIRYSKSTQGIMDLIYKKQRLEAELCKIRQQIHKLKHGTEAYREFWKKSQDLYNEVANINACTDDINWQSTGRQVLGLSYDTSRMLFIPGSGFWCEQHERNARKRASGNEDISSIQFALAIRFLAHTPECKLVHPITNLEADSPSFNPQAYKKYIKEHPLAANV